MVCTPRSGSQSLGSAQCSSRDWLMSTADPDIWGAPHIGIAGDFSHLPKPARIRRWRPIKSTGPRLNLFFLRTNLMRYCISPVGSPRTNAFAFLNPGGHNCLSVVDTPGQARYLPATYPLPLHHARAGHRQLPHGACQYALGPSLIPARDFQYHVPRTLTRCRRERRRRPRW